MFVLVPIWFDGVLFVICIYLRQLVSSTISISDDFVVVEQELLILMEYLSSPPVLSGVRAAQSFSFLCCDLWIIVCSFVLFLLVFFDLWRLITRLILIINL